MVQAIYLHDFELAQQRSSEAEVRVMNNADEISQAERRRLVADVSSLDRRDGRS